MKKGFALLEVLIAVTISSLLTLIIFQAFTQINRAVQSTDRMIDLHTKAALVSWQMEKDIAGAFIPPRALEEHAQKNKPKTATPGKQPEEKKLLTHLFYGTANETNLQTLTCITNNPLQVYGTTKPRIVRVVYTLKPQARVKGWKRPSYILVRQESPMLDFDAFKPNEQNEQQKIREYELINGIKQLTCTYFSKAEKKTQESDDKKIEYKTSSEWNKEEKKKTTDQKEPEPIIPNALECSLTLWNPDQTSDKIFVFTMPIIPDVQYLPKEEKSALLKPLAPLQKQSENT